MADDSHFIYGLISPWKWKEVLYLLSKAGIFLLVDLRNFFSDLGGGGGGGEKK